MAKSMIRRTKYDGVLMAWDGDEIIRRAKELEKMSSISIGLAVEAQAKLLAPVDTGRLRGSIMLAAYGGQYRTSPQGNGSEATDQIADPSEPGEVHVGTAVEYAPYVEYGTMNSFAQPFLRPALDIVKGRVPAMVERDAKKEFAEYMNPRDTFSQVSYGDSE